MDTTLKLRGMTDVVAYLERTDALQKPGFFALFVNDSLSPVDIIFEQFSNVDSTFWKVALRTGVANGSCGIVLIENYPNDVLNYINLCAVYEKLESNITESGLELLDIITIHKGSAISRKWSKRLPFD